jgi:IS5 family transposase
VPHPTTLAKLVRRAGPEVVQELNAALLAKLAGDKLLRAASCGWAPRWWRPTSTIPPNADLLEQAVRKVGGLRCAAALGTRWPRWTG